MNAQWIFRYVVYSTQDQTGNALLSCFWNSTAAHVNLFLPHTLKRKAQKVSKGTRGVIYRFENPLRRKSLMTPSPQCKGRGFMPREGRCNNLRSWSEPSSDLSSLLFMNGNFRLKEKFFFFLSSVEVWGEKNRYTERG